MSTPLLLQPAKIGSLDVPNRIVMAPLTRQRSKQPGNVPYALNAEYYRQRAGAGLIISEGTQITPEGQGYAWTPGIHSEQQIEGWQQATQAVHDAGGRIFAQLWHVGRISHTLIQPNGKAPMAPSAIQAKAEVYVQEPDGSHHKAAVSMPRALETAELATVVKDYAQATSNAIKAGFDGVEVHSANGYLLDQFLCSDSNQRTDAYGGSIENRARLVLEVVDATIKAMGDAGRVGVRFSPLGTFNGVDDANPLETFSYLLGELNSRKLAYVHINKPDWAGGSYEGFEELLQALREVYQGDIILAGGLNAESAEETIQSGLAQFTAFGRPFIANPDLVERIRQSAEWNKLNPNTIYGGAEEGYTDYPTLAG